MSFSGEVKKELLKYEDTKKHCELAELAAIGMFGHFKAEKRGELIIDSLPALRKGFTLCKKNISMDTYMYGHSMVIPQEEMERFPDWRAPEITRETCCKRAFLRGAFLCVGSMSNPEKSYHLEFDCQDYGEAEFLCQLMLSFDLDAKIVERKKYKVAYLKEGSAISDLLNVMGAHVSLMNFENFRVVKDVRNSVNRKVNCETANIAKTVGAASKQIQDILFLQEKEILNDMPKNLQDIAALRLEYPEASLQELGAFLSPEVGKSGVHHRLKKISEEADKLRNL